jgi:mRNA-degrading endonuclease HigB of HigAB toxin-antitoxin module
VNAVGDAKEPILAWYRHALNADWATPADVKADFASQRLTLITVVIKVKVTPTH